jgi:IclR family transcriptional regulator, KDG regulon repressor
MANNTIQSLDRGLKILTILGSSDQPLSLNEIAGHFTIDRSSVFRLISTLLRNNFVQQDAETKKYTLGFRFMELAGSFNEQGKIESVIRPIISRICAATKQNTHLAVLDGIDVVFLAVEQPRESISVNIAVGTREPAIATALGKAILSLSDNGRLSALLDAADLRHYTERSVISKDALLDELAMARKERIAFDREEYKAGIVCIAAPILNYRGEALFSIGISGPSDLMMPRLDEFARIVRDAGAEASLKYGFTGGAE